MTIIHPSAAEKFFAQTSLGIGGLVAAATLQFRHEQVDDILECFRADDEGERHDHEPEEVVFQTALGQEQDRCIRKRRHAARSGCFDREEPGCDGPGSGRDESTAWRRQIDQCALYEDGETGEWQDHLVDQSPSPEAIVVEQDEKHYRRKTLIAAINVLGHRERRIFEARHLTDQPVTLEDLAAQFNLSSERIRQIEARAFKKVRKAAEIART
jgi:RNA polymerase sigma factor (sigma-70 family)